MRISNLCNSYIERIDSAEVSVQLSAVCALVLAGQNASYNGLCTWIFSSWCSVPFQSFSFTLTRERMAWRGIIPMNCRLVGGKWWHLWNLYGKLWQAKWMKIFSFGLKIVSNKEEKMEDMSLHQLEMYTEGHTIGLSFRHTPILSKGIGQCTNNQILKYYSSLAELEVSQ